MAKKSSKVSRRKVPSKAKKPKASTLKSDAPLRGKQTTGKRHLKKPTKLVNVFSLTKSASLVLWQYRSLFMGLSVVYALLNLILVQGLANSTDISSLKNQLDKASHGNLGSLASGFSIFAVLVSSAGNGSSQTAGAYQVFLFLIVSLAIIWSLRQVLAGKQIRVRDAYYLGMYPLVPFILVIIVIGLQLLPLIIGSTLYGIVISNGIAINFIEKALFFIILIALSFWSFYMLTSSLFALYIVTLPEMTPLKALRSAKQLVKNRRWTIFRKIFALPFILLIVAAVIMLPIIILLTPLSQWVFFILTTLSILAIHTYMYTLYRELLND